VRRTVEIVCGFVTAFLAFGATWLASGADVARAADDAFVALPYVCHVDRGQVVVTPAPERLYRIVGSRASHAFTACAPGNANHCRSWQIHKFDLACGAQRVSWLSVVGAAAVHMPAGKAIIENGRLQVRLGPTWQAASKTPKTDLAGVPERTAPPRLAFPPGYAPGLGIGARFVGGTAPPPTVVEARVPKPEPKVSRADPASPTVARDKTPVEPPRTDVSDTWVTTTSTSLDATEPSGGVLLWRAIGGLAAVVAAWGALLLVRSRRAPVAEGLAAAADPADAFSAAAAAMAAAVHQVDDAAVCSELIARAVNLHRAAREAVVTLTNENLRALLSDDLARVQRVLLAPALTEEVAAAKWAPVKTKVMAALADLERIARIIAGVLSSTRVEPVAVLAVAMPETPAEAFEILGINPDASRTIVKKVVDGLRQSWHPDHARDEPDRHRREDRMKQINIAWDLIREQDPTTAQSAA
jgi:hypothetical protein